MEAGANSQWASRLDDGRDRLYAVRSQHKGQTDSGGTKDGERRVSGQACTLPLTGINHIASTALMPSFLVFSIL